MRKLFIFLTVLISLSGCASFDSQRFAYTSPRENEAIEFFNKLDTVVKHHQTHNAAYLRVNGFPYLRASRYLVDLKDSLATNEQQTLWVEKMYSYAIEARSSEIINLPQKALKSFSGNSTHRELLNKLAIYSNNLYQADKSQKDFINALRIAVTDPGEYSHTMRVLGGYPIASIPIKRAAKRAYEEFRHWHKTPLENLVTKGNITYYGNNIKLDYIPTSKILSKENRNAIGQYDLPPSQINYLANIFAPTFAIDVVDTYDKIGQVVWKDNIVTIDTKKPAVYYYISYSKIKDEPVLQLNYTIWLEGRLGPDAPRLEKGRLDGLTYRVSIDSNGNPIMADTQNSCGCYFFFVPKEDSIESIIPNPKSVDPFVPTWLPEGYPSDKIALRISTGWHQIQNISLQNKIDVKYELMPYEQLESLPYNNSESRNVFNHHGIMKDSKRIEPYLFFSAGIPKVGYMRQRGNHPLSLVDYEHFTNPQLYNNSFIFK